MNTKNMYAKVSEKEEYMAKQIVDIAFKLRASLRFCALVGSKKLPL